MPSPLQRIAETIQSHPSGRISPLAKRLASGRTGRALKALFRPSMDGWEHLPDGPVLIVCNHSGTGALEVILLALLWHERFGDARPGTGMAHPVAWFLPGARQLVEHLGATPSTYQNGLRALREGMATLIFPGGDHEAFRPVWQARRVDFNQRKGFLRLAREANVPVVPLGIWGSHYTAPILARTGAVAKLLVVPRLLGVKRTPITLLGALGAVPLAATLGPRVGWRWASLATLLWLSSPPAMFTPVVPWPVNARFGPAFAPEDLFGPDLSDDPDTLQRAYDRVTGAVQDLVDAQADSDSSSHHVDTTP